jgi:GNAT superfamily N-acetyltransferase
MAVPPQRLATVADAPAISALMRASILDLFPRFYDARQTESAAVHIADLDLALIEDGTYFVHEAGGEIVGCGGWSRRDKLFTGAGDQDGDARMLDPATEPARVRAMFVRPDWTRRGIGRAILVACEDAARDEGFRTLALMATLPGEQLYLAYGFRETARHMIEMPDGVLIEGVEMERPVTGADGADPALTV